MTVLYFVEALSPYNVGEVATFDDKEAKLLLDTKKVVKFDSKKPEHVKALADQRGKTEDVEDTNA